jgi:predicted nucleic acid-binding protein
LSAFIDTNVLVRHLTRDPPDQAERATRYLAVAERLLLPDLIVAELTYVLGSIYKAPRPQVARSIRAVLAFPSIRTLDRDLLLRAVEIYEYVGLGFADAYLIASAERSGVGTIVSFDRSIDRVTTVTRLEPS